MAKKDYYEALGVARDASDADIKKAYRKLAMQYHPDRNPDDKVAEEKFREVTEAYEVLKDGDKRAAYDRYGHAAFEGGMGGPGGAGMNGGFEFTGNFSDIFDDLFGDFMGNRRGGRAGPSRGADLRYNLEIPLEEAFEGSEKTIAVTTSVACDTCHGSGAKDGADPTTCETCRGSGKVRAQQGFFTVERPCHSCHGSGQVIKDPCGSCGGSGRVRRSKNLRVNIPPGVDDGTRIRLSGEGEAGLHGAPPGDLYIFLSVAPHPFFKREGADIHFRVPIKMTTAALGGNVDVPTLGGGKARVTIPTGTQTGDQFRLRGKGMSIINSKSRGDMYIHVTVETPVNLSKDQKDLLRKLEKNGGNTSPESEGFFTKVKEFWEDLKE